MTDLPIGVRLMSSVPSMPSHRHVFAVLATALTLVAVPATAWAGPAAQAAQTVDAWAAAPAHLGGPYVDKTVRDIVHTTSGGQNARVRLSNAFGTVPVTFNAVDLGVEDTGAALVPGTNRQVTFQGSAAVTVPVGGEVLSDPVPGSVAAEANLAVSLHVAGGTGEVTGHPDAQQQNYYADGDTAADESAAPYVYTIASWFFVDGIVVDAATGGRGVVTLGDSITDGYNSTEGADRRWPDDLARRLAGTGFAVANEGISGNEVTADGSGVSALARLDRDVLGQPGATTVVFLEGINDIGNGVVTSAGQLIAADQEIADRVHARGMRILGGTLVPFQGAGYYTPERDSIRQAVNAWIRTSGAFDGVVDFDQAVRDPANPDAMLPAYDSGDHLHPGDAGYQAMADAVDLAAL